MNKNLLNAEQERLLDLEGDKLRTMMQSEGWVVMSKLFKGTVEMFDSTRGLKTLKEMLAKQDAIAMMNAWMEQVVQRVERLNHKDAMRREVRERASKSGMVVVSEEEVAEDEG